MEIKSFWDFYKEIKSFSLPNNSSFPINRFSGRRLIAIDRLPACFSVGGLKLTPTAEKYRSLSIEFQGLEMFSLKKKILSQCLLVLKFQSLNYRIKGLIKITNDLPTP